MHRFILLIVFLLLFNAVKSQSGLYAGGGLVYSFTQLEKVNYVIDRYNNTRPYLTQKMGYLSNLFGPSLTFGSQLGENSKYSLNLEYGSYGNSISSKWMKNGINLNSTDLKLNQQVLSLSFGAFPERDDILKVGLGFSLTYGRYSFKVRSNEYNFTSTQKYTLVAAYHSLGFPVLYRFS